MELDLFFGRFHPLVVHLPIGLLIAGYLLHLFSGRSSLAFLEKSVPFVLLIACLSALLSVIFGWFLAEQGYPTDTLFWHRWGGVAILMGSVVLGVGSYQIITIPRRIFKLIYSMVILLVLITGHLGGNLTHGKGYLLEYAPGFIARLLLEDDQPIKQIHPDSATIYTHLISPILTSKCGSCHDSEQKKGGLDVSSYASLSAGGNGGPVLGPQAAESELFRRVTLPPTHRKFMPTNGEPLSYADIQLLTWWLESDATEDVRLSALGNDPELTTLLLRDYGLDVKRKPVYETLRLQSLDESQLEEIRNDGFLIRPIYSGNPFLDVSITGRDSNLGKLNLSPLADIAEYITWLDLSSSEVGNEALEMASTFPYLTRLQLQNTLITDEGLNDLSRLQYLEVLNVYGTNITLAGLLQLTEMKSLKRLYVWNTAVPMEAIEELKASLPNLEIVTGTY